MVRRRRVVRRPGQTGGVVLDESTVLDERATSRAARSNATRGDDGPKWAVPCDSRPVWRCDGISALGHPVPPWAC